MNQSGNGKKLVFYGWWIVAACFIVLFLFAGAGFYSFSIFIRPLETTFGWSRSQISLGMTIYQIVHGSVAPFVGYLAERFGPRRVMAVFMVGFGVSFFLVSQTETLWYFYLSYALLAVMSAGVGWVPISSVLARWFVRRRGTAIGISMVGIAVGGMVMSPLIELFNATYSWRGAFISLGILVWFVGLPVILLVIRGNPREMGLLPDNDPPQAVPESSMTSVTDPDVEAGWPLKPALKTRAFWLIIVAYVLGPMALLGVLQHQVPLITSVGVSEAAAALALGFTAGFGGVGKLGFGRISELIPIHFVFLLCYGMQALGVVVLYNASSMAHIWVFVTIFGFAMGGNIVLLPIIIGRFFGLASFGVIVGIITFFQALGAGAGTFISGLVYDVTGSYEMALQLYIALYLLAIISVFSAGRPREYQAR